MLRSIISIVLNIGYFIVMRVEMYTDRAVMATGETREWHRSPSDRLRISDQTWILYLWIVLAVVSVITSVLMLCGVKQSVVKVVQGVSTIASTVMFIVIMIVTANTHVHYA